MMFPLESIRIGALNPNCAMLPAICAIWASEWRLGFRGYGVRSESFLCSMRCAVARESIPHLVWLRNPSQGAPAAPARQTESSEERFYNIRVRLCIGVHRAAPRKQLIFRVQCGTLVSYGEA